MSNYDENPILLINFYAQFGRMGELHGKTLIRKSIWERLQNRRWYASEVLGKYSEVEGAYNESDFWVKELTEDQSTILADVLELTLEDLDEETDLTWSVPHVCIAGFQPFEYLREDEEDEKDDEE